jgi:ABC-type lipoprotein export system ATPase subunit
VREQILLAGSEVFERVTARLQTMGSNIDLDQRIQDLSGGQRQLLTVLIAVERNPGVLLADEPTAALDSHFAPLVLSLLKERKGGQGQITVVITHGETMAQEEGIREIGVEQGELREVVPI